MKSSNKPRSFNPFKNDNKSAISELASEISKKNNPQFVNNTTHLLLNEIIIDFVNTESFTLRELNRIAKDPAESVFNKIKNMKMGRSKGHYPNYIFYNLIYYLNNICDLDTLISKIERCKSLVQGRGVNYNHITLLGFPSLVGGFDNNKEYEYNYEKILYKFVISQKDDHIYRYYYYGAEVTNGENKKGFNAKDFYEILLLNIKKYRDENGFE